VGEELGRVTANEPATMEKEDGRVARLCEWLLGKEQVELEWYVTNGLVNDFDSTWLHNHAPLDKLFTMSLQITCHAIYSACGA
jgi:hypothetical protein